MWMGLPLRCVNENKQYLGLEWVSTQWGGGLWGGGWDGVGNNRIPCTEGHSRPQQGAFSWLKIKL